MRYSLFITFLLFVGYTSVGQKPERYNAEVFKEIEVVKNVKFGRSTSQGGKTKDLLMDIYYPKGDSEKERPLIILAHGGYFLFGERANFSDQCKFFAQSGYVAVTMDYRLIDIEGDSLMTPKYAVIDAISDMKAAVRFFRKDAANSNEYKISTDNIFIGGYSAGAITALHYAYANTVEDALEMGGKDLVRYIQKNGGIEGNSGNPGYLSTISGVINIAGSLSSAKLVDKNEPPLFSIHGDLDTTVPFETGLTGDTKVSTEGSGLIHKRAEAIGLKNELYLIKGGDHLSIFYCDDCMQRERAFIYSCLR
jgi:predicted esterase